MTQAALPPAIPAFGELTVAESATLLQRNRVGRLAFTLHDRVNVLPVHYRYSEGWLYGRTAPGGDPRDRTAIEGAVVGLPGVRALVQQLETNWPADDQLGPAELAANAMHELRTVPLPEGSNVTVVVDHGWLRVEGTVGSRSARDDIQRRLDGMRGTHGFINRLVVI